MKIRSILLTPSQPKVQAKRPIQTFISKGGLAPQCTARALVSFCFGCVVASSVLLSLLCLKETVLGPKQLLWKEVKVKNAQVFLEHPNGQKTRRENDRNPQVKSALFPIVMSEATAIVQRNPVLSLHGNIIGIFWIPNPSSYILTIDEHTGIDCFSISFIAFSYEIGAEYCNVQYCKYSVNYYQENDWQVNNWCIFRNLRLSLFWTSALYFVVVNYIWLIWHRSLCPNFRKIWL